MRGGRSTIALIRGGGSRRGLRLTSINHARDTTYLGPSRARVYMRCEQRRSGDLQLRPPPIILTGN